MLTSLYKLLLHLYPDHHRSKFGAEMTAVFRQARSQACNENAARRTSFYIREFTGLIWDALQLQILATGESEEPWVWSLEASITAVLLYSFCIWRAEEMGVWGFFFPGTYLLVTVVGGLGAWIVGRECAIIRSWHRWRRALVVFFIVALIVPIIARVAEEGWARLLLAGDPTFTYSIPGIQVVVEEGTSDWSRTPGLTFSRVLTNSDGRIMTMLHHTSGDTPPYLFFGAVLVAVLAFWSRRTAFPRETSRRLPLSEHPGNETQ